MNSFPATARFNPVKYSEIQHYKELPIQPHCFLLFFGKAKVTEFVKSQNFEEDFFCLFSRCCIHCYPPERLQRKGKVNSLQKIDAKKVKHQMIIPLKPCLRKHNSPRLFLIRSSSPSPSFCISFHPGSRSTHTPAGYPGAGFIPAGSSASFTAMLHREIVPSE